MAVALFRVLRSVSPRVRGAIGLFTASATCARLGVIGLTLALARGDTSGAAVATSVAVVSSGFGRVVAAVGRAALERDLVAAGVRASLAADVLAVPAQDAARALLHGEHHARVAAAELLPSLVADGIAVLVALPLLASLLPKGGAMTLLLAISGAAAAVLAVSRAARRMQAELDRAHEMALDRVSDVVHARLEIVAGGREAEAEASLSTDLARFVEASWRTSFGAAVAGRVPLVVGLALVGVALALDDTLRAHVLGGGLGAALVVASALPPAIGVVLGATQLVRASQAISPYVQLLDASPRPEPKTGAWPPPSWSLEVRALSFRYAPSSPRVLDAVGLAGAPGEILVLVGPNGSGKSTLLRLLLALRAPEAGAIHVGGRPLAELDLRAYRRATVYLPQRAHLGAPHATLADAIGLGSAALGEGEMLASLARFGLDVSLGVSGRDLLSVRVGELSAGQRQRVALARAFARPASLYLLDEPEANLDTSAIAQLHDVLKDVGRRGALVIVAAHGESLRRLGREVVLSAPGS